MSAVQTHDLWNKLLYLHKHFDSPGPWGQCSTLIIQIMRLTNTCVAHTQTGKETPNARPRETPLSLLSGSQIWSYFMPVIFKQLMLLWTERRRLVPVPARAQEPHGLPVRGSPGPALIAAITAFIFLCLFKEESPTEGGDEDREQMDIK